MYIQRVASVHRDHHDDRDDRDDDVRGGRSAEALPAGRGETFGNDRSGGGGGGGGWYLRELAVSLIPSINVSWGGKSSMYPEQILACPVH